MKTIWKLSLLALVVFSLCISACGGDDDDNNDLTGPGDITPANTDWEIIFVNIPNAQKTDNYSIMMDWLGDPNALSQTDTFSMKIDGTEYPVSSYWMFGMMIWAEAQLNPGQTYNFEFYKNAVKICDANIRMPYNAIATFPTSYAPTNSANISWTLSNNNQYQFAGVSAYGGMEQMDDDIVQIQPSARSYTVPANAVTGFGAGTEYELLVTQMNFVRDGRTAISAAQGQYKEYSTKTATKDDLIRLIRKITRSMAL